MKNKGYTLLEILVIILLIGLFSTFFIRAMLDTYKSEKVIRFTIKSEADIKAFKTYLKRELELIGFGVPKNDQKFNCIEKLFTGKNPLALVSQDELIYYSLAQTARRWSGCWYIYISNQDIYKTTAKNRFGENCPFPNSTINNINDHYFIAFDKDKKFLGIYKGSDTKNIPRDQYYIVYIDNETDSIDKLCDRMFTKIYLNKSPYVTDDRICHPSLQKSHLMIVMGNNTIPQPILSCVADLRMSCIDKKGEETNCNNLNTVYLKVCMMVQKGGRTSIPQNPPKYSSLCGGNTPSTITDLPDYQYYRFVPVEEVIPLYNLQSMQF